MKLRIVLGILLPLCGLGLAACAPGESADEGLSMPADGEGVELPDPGRDGEASLEQALSERRSVRSFADAPLDMRAIAQLLWAAQGVSDPARGLRTAPSAGATYPLETYVVAGNVTGLEPGVYRYSPEDHALVLTDTGDVRGAIAAAALSQDFIAEAPATIVIAGVYARTAQRYGERATRYVHMEVGHAGQNICLQATALGLGTVPVGAFRDQQVAEVLGLPADHEPLYLLPVGHP